MFRRCSGSLVQSKGAQPLAKEQGRPGVMIYFEVRESLKFLSLEEKGKLFDAVLEYGELGVIPEFDGMLGMAWAFMKPKLDADAERYDNAILQRRYAVATREAKKAGQDLPSFAEWKTSLDIGRYREVASDIECYPTTITTASPTTTPTTTATTEIKKKEEKELSMPERKEQMMRQLKAYQE